MPFVIIGFLLSVISHIYFGESRHNAETENAALQKTVNNLVGVCMQRNWNVGILQGRNAYDLQIKVYFSLDKSGNFIGAPDFTPSGGGEKDRQAITQQAQKALELCAPAFKELADKYPDKYDEWKNITINMKAFPD